MNRFRGFSIGSAALLLLFAVWGTLYYQRGHIVPAFAFTAGAGLLVLALRPGIRRLHLGLRRWRQRELRTSRGTQVGVIFVSQNPVDNDVLDDLYERFTGSGEDLEPSMDEFSEGRGLTLVHTGFHNTFVRITRSGQLAVTGGSEKTRGIVDVVANMTGYEFEERKSNPMLRSRLGSRVRIVLWLVVLVALLVGLSVGSMGAYSERTYNSAERMILIGMDVHGAVDPTVSPAETALSKANFMVQVLDETTVELHWDRNRSEKIVQHTDQAVVVSKDASQQLARAQQSGMTTSQTTRTAQVRQHLSIAGRNVSRAIGFVINHNHVNDSDVPHLRAQRKQLLVNTANGNTNTSPTTSVVVRPKVASAVRPVDR